MFFAIIELILVISIRLATPNAVPAIPNRRSRKRFFLEPYGVNGVERTMKAMCCGNSTSTNYVAAEHFTAKMIGTKSLKKLSGGSLWRAGLDVARLIKKAMAILPKLDVKVVNLGNNLQVLGYASGKNFENFIQYIDNGMYSLSLKDT